MDKKQKVLDKLKELGIFYEKIDHPAAFTVEDIDQMGVDKEGEIAKNLFLRDDKGKNHFLVVLEKNKTADLKELRSQLKSTRLGFASEERLEKYLNLTKGSVTPLGVINDIEAKVNVVFDKDLMKMKRIGVHPNDNTSTVFLSFEDLKSFVEHCGNKILYVEI